MFVKVGVGAVKIKKPRYSPGLIYVLDTIPNYFITTIFLLSTKLPAVRV